MIESIPPPGLSPADVMDTPDPVIWGAMYRALHASSDGVAGPAMSRWLIIPLRGLDGCVTGGFWGCTSYRWLQIQMLIVPAGRRKLGLGTALMHRAEAEARARGCIGAQVSTFSFQAAPFYEKLGYQRFGILDDCPPGHHTIFLRKLFG